MESLEIAISFSDHETVIWIDENRIDVQRIRMPLIKT